MAKLLLPIEYDWVRDSPINGVKALVVPDDVDVEAERVQWRESGVCRLVPHSNQYGKRMRKVYEPPKSFFEWLADKYEVVAVEEFECPSGFPCPEQP